MTTTMEVHWGATQLHPIQTTARGKRWLAAQDYGEASISRWLQPVPYGHGSYERGWVAAKPRRGFIEVMAKTRDEGDAFDEIEALDAIFSLNVIHELKLVLPVHGGGSRSRILDVRRVGADSFGFGAGHELLGSFSGGVVRYRVPFEAALPFWRKEAADTDTNLSVQVTTDSQAIAVDGDVPVGLKVTLSNLVGTWTSLTITNTTAGPEGEDGGALIWTATGGFNNADVLDFKRTEPHVVTVASGSLLSATSYIRLWPGSNTIEAIGVGGTSGDITLEWDPRYL